MYNEFVCRAHTRRRLHRVHRGRLGGAVLEDEALVLDGVVRVEFDDHRVRGGDHDRRNLKKIHLNPNFKPLKENLPR